MSVVALRRISGPVTELSGPVDYNTFTSTGVYHQGSYGNAKNSTNGPSSNPGLIEVFAGSGMVYQRYTVYRGSRTYVRDYYAYTSEWSAWRELT